jgi:hypothetical protein
MFVLSLVPSLCFPVSDLLFFPSVGKKRPFSELADEKEKNNKTFKRAKLTKGWSSFRSLLFD